MSDSIDRIRELLEDHGAESYSRFDGEHPYDVFLGVDKVGRKSLALVMDAKRERIASTKTIEALFYKREDDKLMLNFSLVDDDLKDIFYKFCEDIIESTRLNQRENSFTPAIDRWNTWIQFFSKSVLPLSENEVLGLIGEICFLQNVMVKKYGQDIALESYIGTDLAHKDFEVLNTWYEVKSIHNGVRAVKISSIEQLDSDIEGKLAILTFDQGTPSCEGNITLNKLISEFRNTLDRKWQLLFDQKMRKARYIEDERYDDYNHIFVNLDSYRVLEDFPKLTKQGLPQGVTKASYEIDISAIQRFKD